MNGPTQAQIDAVRDREILINATIERCAQVADATGGNGYAIAVAIRALKNEP